MSVQLSIDLSDATFADLRALVDAARTAGVDSRARLELEDTTLIVTADGTTRPEPETEILDRDRDRGTSAGRNQRPAWDPAMGHQLGDAAIRSVIDILTGRQDPPRGSN